MEELTSVILEAVFTILGVLVAALVAYFTPILKRWIGTGIEKDRTGIFESVVDMGVELAEKELSGANGEMKFDRATDYVAEMLRDGYNIDVSGNFVKGSVQAGWRRHNEKQKGDVING